MEQKKNIVLAIDASGLKCSDEKEWTQSQYRRKRRRKFIKIHAAVNIKTRHVLFNKYMTSRMSDISILPQAINNVEGEIDTLFANSGYDSKGSCKLTKLDTKVVIPHRRNAVTNKHTHQRNEAIK